jgi:uncharacterized RDD family membrane protein YckC
MPVATPAAQAAAPSLEKTPAPETAYVPEPEAAAQPAHEPAPQEPQPTWTPPPQHEWPAQPYAGPVLSPGSAWVGDPPRPDGADSYPPGYRGPVFIGGRPLARETDRLIARIIDTVIVTLTNLVASMVLVVAPLIVLVAARVENPWPYVLVYVVGFSLSTLCTLAVVYYHEVIYQGSHGQTFGKRQMRVKVVDLATGAPPDRRALQRRFLGYNCVSLALVVPVIGLFVAMVAGMYNYINPLWCLWDRPFQQCLHDKYAKTVVIKVAE